MINNLGKIDSFLIQRASQLHIVWAIYYIYIAVEVTMNIAEHTPRWRSQLPENVNFMPTVRGLKMIYFTGTKCKISFIYM